MSPCLEAMREKKDSEVRGAVAKPASSTANANSNAMALSISDEHFAFPMFGHLSERLSAPPEGRVLYISRHGESMYNLDNRLGGDPDLSPQGRKYARALGSYIRGLDIEGLKVWTSHLQRTHQTVEFIDAPKTSWRQLNEIDSGDYDDLTYEEFEAEHPEHFAERERNKLTFRYPNGESYVDLCRRIEQLLPALNGEHNVLLVSHQAVIRCIMAFLLGSDGKEIPYIKVPLHCIIQVTFLDGENVISFNHLPIECVDTYRPKVEAKTEPEARSTYLNKWEAVKTCETITY